MMISQWREKDRKEWNPQQQDSNENLCWSLVGPEQDTVESKSGPGPDFAIY